MLIGVKQIESSHQHGCSPEYKQITSEPQALSAQVTAEYFLISIVYNLAIKHVIIFM